MVVRKRKITTKDIMLFIRQLATLLSSGMPLLQSLDAIQGGSKKAVMRGFIADMRESVNQGIPLSQAMQKHRKCFDALTIQLVVTGELSGNLGDMLLRIAAHKEKAGYLREKIKKAFFYPCAVMAVAVIVTWILLTYVVPQFATLFSGFGAKLPLLTRSVIVMANVTHQYGWLVLLLCLLGIWFVFIARHRNVAFAAFLDRLSFRLPWIGSILQTAMVARFTRILAIVIAAGVPLLESLEALHAMVSHAVFKCAIAKVREAIQEGQALHVAMQQSLVFPNIAVEMVAIGEEVGKLARMLEKAAELYEAELASITDKLGQLMEPLIMVILGVVIGGLVVAMYLPIFKLGTVI